MSMKLGKKLKKKARASIPDPRNMVPSFQVPRIVSGTPKGDIEKMCANPQGSVERRTCTLRRTGASPKVGSKILHFATMPYNIIFPTHGDTLNKVITGGSILTCTTLGGPMAGIQCAAVAEGFDSYLRDPTGKAINFAIEKNPLTLAVKSATFPFRAVASIARGKKVKF